MRASVIVLIVAACAHGISALPTQEAGRFTVSGVRGDREVEQFYLDFQKAVALDDRRKVAAMMNYPLRVNFHSDALERGYRVIRSRYAFLKAYERIFSRTLKSFIAKTTVADIWANYRGIATPGCEIWIGVFCKRADCDAYYIKVRTIEGNSVFLKTAGEAHNGMYPTALHQVSHAR